MNIEDAIRHALDGNAVIFTGAGFSRGAINRKNTAIKTAKELADELAQACGLPVDTPLEDASEAYQTKFGHSRLISYLLDEFTVKEVASHHLEILKIPWTRAYTTNYDNVFELGSEKVGRVIQSATMLHNPFSLQKSLTTIIHLNGSINELTTETLDSSFKLTETSYISASISESKWSYKLREDVRLARSVLFIGYSMFDLDIKRLLYDSHNLREKCFFVVGPNPTALLMQRVSRYGTVLSIGVSDFAEKVTSLQRTYTPPPNEEPLLSIREVITPPNQDPPKDQDVINLFELGSVDESAVLASLYGPATYFLKREKLNQARSLLESGSKAIAITSHLGNGKSLFLKGLCLEAIEQGYRVFEAQNHTENAALEFERIAKLPGKILLIVDNYQSWIREIESFSQIINPQAQLVATSREVIHDVLVERLEKSSGVRSLPEIHLNKLSESECEWFIAALDQYGLWRSKAGLSRREKLRIITDEYRSEIHGILLGLLNSKDIGQRINSLLTELQSSPQYFDVIATTFITAILGLRSSTDMLADIWGVDLLSSSRFRLNQCVKQLINFDSDEIRITSPIISEYALKSVPPKEIVNILIRLTTHISKAERGSYAYKPFLNEICRFAALQRIIGDEGIRDDSSRYYESVKTLPQYERNPLFWLQYAISCFFNADLKRARIYFEVAYSHAERSGFNPYQIDNHYARFLLEEAIEANANADIAMEKFRQAHTIVSRQTRDERRHYPYTTASYYQPFIDKFGSIISMEKRAEIRNAARYVMERIEELAAHTKAHNKVRDCEAAMRYVIERCDDFERRKTAPPPTPPLPRPAKQP